jgi:hypothetical protein
LIFIIITTTSGLSSNLVIEFGTLSLGHSLVLTKEKEGLITQIEVILVAFSNHDFLIADKPISRVSNPSIYIKFYYYEGTYLFWIEG